jgi:Ni2+-binding GTPase involved in maturation of urease and hydrogenase
MKQRDQRSIQVIIFQRAELIRINKIDLAEKIDIFNNIQNNLI